MNHLVTREDRGRVAVLTLTNPPANGYSLAMHQALDAHVVELRMDVGIDVVVIRGAGDRFFCAGADIKYLKSLTPEQKYAFCLHANETLLRIENTPKLFIAALNGHCVGGGLEVALGCDLRIGRAREDKPCLVGLPEVNLGVLPGTGGTQRLSRVIGRSKALQWMIDGLTIPVQEAVGIGLIHRVLPDEGWWDAVLAIAESYCRPGKAAGAVGLIKRAVVGGSDLPLESGLALERELQQRLFQAPDAAEGLAAFVEKRKARFTGQADGGAPPASPPRRPRASPPPPPAAAEPPASASPASVPQHQKPPADAGRMAMSLRGARAEEDPPPPPEAGTAAPGDAGPAPTWTPPVDIPEGFEDFADFGPPEPPPEVLDRAFGGTGTPTDQADAPRTHKAGDVHLRRMKIPDEVLNLLPRSIVERYGAVPVYATETTIAVAMVDPSNQEAREIIAEETGLMVQALGASEEQIWTVIAEEYRA